MTHVTTREAVIDAAWGYFQPFLFECEDLDAFIHHVDADMNAMKCDVISKCIESFDDQIRLNAPPSWTILKRIERSVIAVFGKITYMRTLFVDEYGRRRYLTDELLGIPKRARFTADAVLWLLKRVAVVSYARCAADFAEMSGCTVSGMAVWHMVQREAELIKRYGFDDGGVPLSQTDVFVESDGIFIALQSERRRKEAIERFFYEQSRKKRSFEIKVGCIYAGKAKVGARNVRGNVSLVACAGTKGEFWGQMNERIATDYNISDIERFWVASDGGAWCKDHAIGSIAESGARINQTIDSFHVMQAIWRAFPDGRSQDWLVSLVIRRRPEALADAIVRMLPKIHGKRREKVKSLHTYIVNNAELLRSGFNLGTMEATNAYVWAKRMKRFGCAWSRRGAEAMAILLSRIHSHQKLIAPRKDALFSIDQVKRMEAKIQERGMRAAMQFRCGCGYEPARGHIPWHGASGETCNPLNFVSRHVH